MSNNTRDYNSTHDLSNLIIRSAHQKLPNDLNVDKLPSYLLELKFGEKLYGDLLEAMMISSTTLPGLTKARELFKRKLATFGVLGKFPDYYSQDESYCDELMEIFRSREVRPMTPSSASLEDHIDKDLDLTLTSSDKLIDRLPSRLISVQLWNELENEEMMGGKMEQKLKFKFPLPSAWSILMPSSFKVNKDKLILTTPRDDLRSNFSTSASSSSTSSYRPSLAWSNKSVPVDCTVYYYEVTILDGLQASDVSIGFLYENLDKYLNQMPGLDIRSFGYNGREGKIHSKSDNINESFGLKFGVNDVIGCGINRYTEKIFYTKNGILLGDAFSDIKKKPLYPCIGMGDYISVKTNFGLKNDNGNFMFDIDNYVKNYKDKVHQKIGDSLVEKGNDGEKINSTKKRNGLREEDIPEVLNSFVLSHLNHSGFAQSWNALMTDLKLQERLFAGEMSTSDDENDISPDLIKREQIRTLLEDYEIDDLIRLLEVEYKVAFNSNCETIFKLKCLKLLSIIKIATFEQKDQLLLNAVDYGKALKEEYKDDNVKIEYLNDISSLLAFKDPTESKYGYLLNSLEVRKTFDELNKIILRLENKDESSIFERIINQTEAILNVLIERGDNEAMMVNISKDYLQ